jgi:HPt (histidine-containing phosphotransfer) domain-containing protein
MPKLLATYVADLTRAAGDMRAAITSTDARAAGRAVHSIKSVAINLGAVELAELADRAERRSKTSVGIDIETVNEITQVTNLLVEEVLDLSSQFVK